MAEPKVLERTLELARVGLAPSAAERQRLRAALALNRVPGPGGGPELETALSQGRPSSSVVAHGALSSGGWVAIGAPGKAGVIAGLLLVGAGFVGGYWAGLREGTQAAAAPTAMTGIATATPVVVTPAPVVAVEVSPAAPPSSAPPEPVAVPGSSPAPSTPAPHFEKAARPGGGARIAPRQAPSADAFDQEMALLQRVERALRNEDPALVSVLLNELDANHPRGVLNEERRAARVMARCQAKDLDARLVAQRFLRAIPNSVYTDRVRSLCDLE